MTKPKQEHPWKNGFDHFSKEYKEKQRRMLARNNQNKETKKLLIKK